MPTNRLGRGTVNVPVNWLDQERDTLGRIAMEEDLSLGGLIRKLAMERLAQTHPHAAAVMVGARQERRALRLRVHVEKGTSL